MLVTPQSMWLKSLYMHCAKACWDQSTYMIQNVTKPEDVKNHTIEASIDSGWSKELYDIVDKSLNSMATFRKLYPTDEDRETRLALHVSFTFQLLSRRAMSLAAYYLQPPTRYSGVLLGGASNPTFKQMMLEKDILYKAEAAAADGDEVEALDLMLWRNNALVRTLLLAHESNDLEGTALKEDASGMGLQLAMTKHMPLS